MKYDPAKHHRRSIRLKGYDYTQNGAYFVTICVQNRECLFGKIVDEAMRLNGAGQIVVDTWEWLASQYDHVDLDNWVVMPNHLHGIIVLTDDGDNGDDGRGGSRTAPTNHPKKRKPLGRLIGAFKTVSTKHINAWRQTPGNQLWQRNYYEHIIRNEASLNQIQEYILNNPRVWTEDSLFVKESP
ncbi:transposase [Deltaproteobacteria bacterium TL4]